MSIPIRTLKPMIPTSMVDRRAQRPASSRGTFVKSVLYLVSLIACVVGTAALGLQQGCLGWGLDHEPSSVGTDPLGPLSSLRGQLYLENSRRLALYWESGDFELWDTEHGRRLGRVVRLHRPIDWCVASPDQTTILTGDRMPSLAAAAFVKQQRRFVATVSVWDAKSGVRKHLIEVPEVAGRDSFIHEWYARWLNNSRVLLVRLLRQNPSRAACQLRLIVIDAVAGKVVKASEEYRFSGEHLFLSPDRKMALVKDDNYVRRAKSGKGVEGATRNIYARTHVFDVDRLTIISSWREPRDPEAPDWKEFNALIARWCPDGNTVVTVSNDWFYDRPPRKGRKWDSQGADAPPPPTGHPAPRVRLWDARRGRLLLTLFGHTNYILDLALTANGDKLLTASEDRTVRVWSTRTGKLEAVLSGHNAGLNKVIALPGDRLAVSAAEEPVAKVWDLTTGKLKFDLPDHDSAVRDVEVVSDKVVRTTTLRGTTTTWDCLAGIRLRVTPKPPDFPKRFGVCELIEEGGKLHMRLVNQAPTPPK